MTVLKKVFIYLCANRKMAAWQGLLNIWETYHWTALAGGARREAPCCPLILEIVSKYWKHIYFLVVKAYNPIYWGLMTGLCFCEFTRTFLPPIRSRGRLWTMGMIYW